MTDWLSSTWEASWRPFQYFNLYRLFLGGGALLGALFVAVGLDTQILARQTGALTALFKGTAPVAAPKASVY